MAFTWLSGFSVDGNVGIGTLSSGAALTLQTAPDAQALNIIGRSDGLGFLQFFGSDGSTLYGSIGGSSSGLSFTGNATFGGQSSMDSGSFNPLILDRTGFSNVNMSFKHGGVLKGYLGVGSNNILTFGPNADSGQNTPLVQDLSNYVDKTTDQSIGGIKTFTSNSIFNNSVGIGTSSPSVKLDVDGAGKFSGQVTIPETPVADTDAASKGYVDGRTLPGTFIVGSKSVGISEDFATVVTVNLANHTGCYVSVTCFGDWPNHSTAAYRGEFFLQNGGGGHAQPGMIIRQDDNTSDGSDQIIAQIVDPPTTNPADFKIQLRHTDTTSPATFTGLITYTVQGKFNSVS